MRKKTSRNPQGPSNNKTMSFSFDFLKRLRGDSELGNKLSFGDAERLEKQKSMQLRKSKLFDHSGNSQKLLPNFIPFFIASTGPYMKTQVLTEILNHEIGPQGDLMAQFNPYSFLVVLP